MDGATNFQAFYKVVVPLAAPGLATAGILTFIAAWNEFLLAITLTSSTSARTVPAAIAFFTGSTQFEQPLGTISAASVVDLDPADPDGAPVPEADRRRPHRRRGQGVMWRWRTSSSVR